MEPYQRHGNYGAKETSFPCPYEGCSYKTNNRSNWRVHRQMHKIRETKRFGCDECDFAANYAGMGSFCSIEYLNTQAELNSCSFMV